MPQSMDGDIGFGYTHHRQKRTHAQMEDDEPSSPLWPNPYRLSVPREPSARPSRSPQPQFGALHLPSISNIAPTPPRRYPGDGLDYRHPTSMSRAESQQPVIDLTVDDAGPGPSGSNSRQGMHRPQQPSTRLPRFAREIIDVEDDEAHRLAAPPDSPDIEFISARRLNPPHRESPPANLAGFVDAEEDDVEILGSNSVPGFREGHAYDLGRMLAGVFRERGQQDGGRQFVHLRQRIRHMAAAQAPVVPPRAAGAGHIHFGFVAPGPMNFELVGFELGIGGGEPRPATPPTYNPPPPAPDGFTRKPEDEDVYVCPNCGVELRTGESDLKKQVWMVKSCGHIYCGECTVNRFSRKRSAKGKEKALPANHKPFKECVVEGCSKRTNTPKAMTQLFL